LFVIISSSVTSIKKSIIVNLTRVAENNQTYSISIAISVANIVLFDIIKNENATEKRQYKTYYS